MLMFEDFSRLTSLICALLLLLGAYFRHVGKTTWFWILVLLATCFQTAALYIENGPLIVNLLSAFVFVLSAFIAVFLVDWVLKKK